MTDQTTLELLHPSGRERVLIVRRGDGRFTYRCQEWSDGDWGPPTIDAGVYDSAATAETEARQRIAWLRALFH